MKPLELPIVTRVHDDHGSHIEPPLDQSWDEATKLAWHAAVIATDTGLRIDVDGRALPGEYAITVGSVSCSAMDYGTAWVYLNGIRSGADAKETERHPLDQRTETTGAPKECGYTYRMNAQCSAPAGHTESPWVYEHGPWRVPTDTPDQHTDPKDSP